MSNEDQTAARKRAAPPNRAAARKRVAARMRTAPRKRVARVSTSKDSRLCKTSTASRQSASLPRSYSLIHAFDKQLTHFGAVLLVKSVD